MYGTIERAADVARHNIPIQKKVTKPEYWSRYAIIGRGDGYRVVKECDLQPPESTGLLPWSNPLRGGGKVVAYVELDGALVTRPMA